ncbi:MULTISPECIES: hypothetical protein [Campylobacter]|uniref:hypothetical protein n=1 Tax=Campylobacter TaxID=194 RepID=UPI00147025FB|nr:MULTISPECIES: hypothetical protein [Campylobacter]MBN7288349.1 hypothetical protein [Campylobacter curvus]MDU6826955.1 hypothetical protein [Campylobacter sp.]
MRKILTLTLLCAALALGGEFNLNPADGAVVNLTPLRKIGEITPNLNNNNPVTGLDYDAASGSFLLGTLKFELYEMDGELKTVKNYLRSTPDWIIQMEETVAASFFKGSIGAMSYNKTYEFFKPAPNQSKEEANKAWRYLHDGYENFTLDFKDRYSTVRAKQQYILSWDHSDFYGEFFIASVPDDIKQSWSVASFSDADNLLSSEFVPSFDETLGVKEGRDVSDYYVTGMDAQGEFVYLLSKQYSSILKLDPRSRKIAEVYSFEGANDAHALAIKEGKFYVASRENGANKIFVFER